MPVSPSTESFRFEIFPWNDSFATGIALIDEQHKQLVAIMNRLARHFVAGTHAPNDIELIIKELADYADYHFRSEEEVWHRHFEGHPLLADHEHAHHDFFAKVASIRSTQGSLEDFADDLFGFLTRWLAFHILDNDKRMALATLSLDAGASMEQALQEADSQMTGALAVLIRTVLDMYGELSANTIELMRQKLARQRAEDALHDTQQQLVERNLSLSEERYAVLFDAIPDGVVVAEIPSGRIVDVNSLMGAMTGYSLPHLRELCIFDLHPAADREFHIANLAQLARMAITESTQARFEAQLLRADGSQMDVEVSVRGPFRRGDELCLVGVMRDIRERKKHREALEHVAYFDELTGLLNRNGIKRHLEALIPRCRNSVLVVHADLDNFTRINERHGAEIGDRLLQAFAQRLRTALPVDSRQARLGGDEFLLVFETAPAQAELPRFIETLMHTLQQPLRAGDAEIPVTVSLGLKYCESLQHTSAEVLMRQSAHALYLAKIQGVSQYHVLDQAQENAERRRNVLRNQIEHGLHTGQFELFFQPKVDMQERRVIGAEALIRWRHPQEGLLSPALFIPATQNHPIGVVMDDWVLRKSVQQLALWCQRWPGLKLSCNISAMSIQDSTFSQRLEQVLAEQSQVQPHTLEIELLESSAMQDMNVAIATLERCRALGVSIAIDDFGTGYSSLSYLKRLPVNWLKLDQSFVAEMSSKPDDVAIIEGIVAIGQAFGLQMIAEGVETEEQMQLLVGLGCRFGQGYAIGRPMPVLEFERWMYEWPQRAAALRSQSSA